MLSPGTVCEVSRAVQRMGTTYGKIFRNKKSLIKAVQLVEIITDPLKRHIDV